MIGSEPTVEELQDRSARRAWGARGRALVNGGRRGYSVAARCGGRSPVGPGDRGCRRRHGGDRQSEPSAREE